MRYLVTLIVFILTVMEMFHESDGLRCFSGYGVYAQDFIDQAEADPILCPEEVPQVCVIGNISIEIFGISLYAEVGQCFNASLLELLSCQYLLDQFQDTGTIPEDIDVQAFSLDNCTTKHCSTDLCNVIDARRVALNSVTTTSVPMVTTLSIDGTTSSSVAIWPAILSVMICSILSSCLLLLER